MSRHAEGGKGLADTADIAEKSLKLLLIHKFSAADSAVAVA
jgi:hypothetical protein